VGALARSEGAVETAPNSKIVREMLNAGSKHDSNVDLMVALCQTLESFAVLNANMREHMKMEGAMDALKTWQEKHAKDELLGPVARAAYQAITSRQAADAEYRQLKKSDRSAALKAEDKIGEEKIKKLSKAQRNFLKAGTLCKRVKDAGEPETMHLYIEEEMKKLCWKSPKKAQEADDVMKVYQIKLIEPGRSTKALQRKKGLMGSKPIVKEECAFSIMGQGIELSLECSSEEDRDKWVEYLKVHVAAVEEKKRQNVAAVAMFSAKLGIGGSGGGIGVR
jgi:hypothetical protein